MPTATVKPRKKSTMTSEHKDALARGREEGRIVRRYLEALESNKPKRGRKRTPDSIKKQLVDIDAKLAKAAPLDRLHLIQRKQELEVELKGSDAGVDLGALEKNFVKVAASYGERKGISYSAWRTVGVSASVLAAARIPRTRG